METKGKLRERLDDEVDMELVNHAVVDIDSNIGNRSTQDKDKDKVTLWKVSIHPDATYGKKAELLIIGMGIEYKSETSVMCCLKAVGLRKLKEIADRQKQYTRCLMDRKYNYNIDHKSEGTWVSRCNVLGIVASVDKDGYFETDNVLFELGKKEYKNYVYVQEIGNFLWVC